MRITGIDYKLMSFTVNTAGKKISYLLGVYSGWIDKPDTIQHARETAYAMLVQFREKYPTDQFWIIREDRRAVPFESLTHTRPELGPDACWVFDSREYGEATANRLHPLPWL